MSAQQQSNTPPAAAGTPAAPAPGTPEHDAAMVAKVDANAAAAAAAAADAPITPTEPARPEWLPEKFKTVEDMAKAYGELEKKLGTPATPDPAKAAASTDPKQIPADAPKVDESAKAAEDAAKAAGLNMDALSQEFAESGTLKPESFAALEKAGIPKAMVDAYIQGQQALAQQYDAQAFSEAGGEKEYTEIVTWAKTALTPGEQSAFDTAVSSGNVDVMKLAVQGLKGRYTAANGAQPNLVGGKPAVSDGGYDSMAQVTSDMKKPEYKTDPAFRAKVERKLAASTFLQTQERS